MLQHPPFAPARGEITNRTRPSNTHRAAGREKGVYVAKKKYDETEDTQEASKVAIDTCTWQMLASVFWPGSFIRLVVAASSPHQFEGFVFKELDYIPTIIGLLTIPLIVKPIDETVDAIMEKSVKKILNDDVHSKDEMIGVVTTFGGALMVPPVLYACADLVRNQ